MDDCFDDFDALDWDEITFLGFSLKISPMKSEISSGLEGSGMMTKIWTVGSGLIENDDDAVTNIGFETSTAIRRLYPEKSLLLFLKIMKMNQT